MTVDASEFLMVLGVFVGIAVYALVMLAIAVYGAVRDQQDGFLP